ncbi:MAG: hypothetical protein K2H64_03640 [Desulfovibrio sp.]|nr:hypothetical protein [Desulfovibrio sp.]
MKISSEIWDSGAPASVPFYKFSPGGNDTLFVIAGGRDVASLCADALARLGAEQAAAADPRAKTMLMGGGEFCVNASRAFGALLDYLGEQPDEKRGRLKRYRAAVSGLNRPVELSVAGAAPRWEAAATFEPGIAASESREGTIVHLSGISHLILIKEAPALSGAEKIAVGLGRVLELDRRPAWGVVWSREKDGIFEILPYVAVPASGTAMFESSCGSASVALALALGRDFIRVRQPSGDLLTVKINPDNGLASVSGAVELVAEGRVYLQRNDQ